MQTPWCQQWRFSHAVDLVWSPGVVSALGAVVLLPLFHSLLFIFLPLLPYLDFIFLELLSDAYWSLSVYPLHLFTLTFLSSNVCAACW